MVWFVCRACVKDDTDEAQCEFHIDNSIHPEMAPVSGRCLLSSGLVANWQYGGA